MDGADPYENSHPCARTNNYTDTDEMSIIYIGNGILVYLQDIIHWSILHLQKSSASRR